MSMCRGKRGQEGGRHHGGARHPSRLAAVQAGAQKAKIGAALAIVGVHLWVSFVVLRFATEDPISDNLLYLGITVGGAAVVAGIILIATIL
jgi:hypothetical protein